MKAQTFNLVSRDTQITGDDVVSLKVSWEKTSATSTDISTALLIFKQNSGDTYNFFRMAEITDKRLTFPEIICWNVFIEFYDSQKGVDNL